MFTKKPWMEPGFLPDDFQSLDSEQIYYHKQFQKGPWSLEWPLTSHLHSLSLSLLTYKMGIIPTSSSNTEVLDTICKGPNSILHMNRNLF